MIMQISEENLFEAPPPCKVFFYIRSLDPAASCREPVYRQAGTLAIHLNKIYQNKNKDTNKKSKYGGNSLRRKGLLFNMLSTTRRETSLP